MTHQRAVLFHLGAAAALVALLQGPALAQSNPTLRISGDCSGPRVDQGQQSCIDVELLGRGKAVASMGFTLTYSTAALRLPLGSGNVLAGGALNGGQSFIPSVLENAGTGQGTIQIVIIPPITRPIPTISDGKVARLCFTVAPQAQDGCTAVQFKANSVDIGDSLGRDLAFDAPTSGGVLVGGTRSPVAHYACYAAKPVKAKRGEPELPAFEKRQGVSFEDLTGSTLVDVVKPAVLCNPVDKEGEDPTAPQKPEHLEGYVAKLSSTKPKQDKPEHRLALLENQFGVVALEVKGADRVLIPSAKALGRGGATPLLDPSAIDHFQCYKAAQAKAGRGEPELPTFSPRSVKLRDQFEGPIQYDVTKPSRLCHPANKLGEDPEAPTREEHLVCYLAKRTKTKPAQPKFEKREVSTNNQFGDEVLEAVAFAELCVPSKFVAQP